MIANWKPQPDGPIPGAIHGKYVPGLPWDTLPPPIWEPDSDEPDPIVAQVEALRTDLHDQADAEQQAEDDASYARVRQREIRGEIDKLLATLAITNPRLAAELKDDLDR